MTTKQPFLNNGENEIQTDLMAEYGVHYPYAEWKIGGEKVQVVELGYQEDGMSMVIILPEKRGGLKDIVSSANFASDVTKFLKTGSLKSQLMNIFLPKFNLETDHTLNETLTDMGISNIFGPEADFSGINGRTDLFVSLVKHKAVVKVDEEGTEAAAVTGVFMNVKSLGHAPPRRITFRADHPFLFLIKDKNSGLVLFVGKVESL